jgi:hypothetical protein
MFQDKNEARTTFKKYRHFTAEDLHLTKELLVDGALGEHFAALGSGFGLGELSLLGIGNIYRACAAVATETTTMLMIEPALYREYLRFEHLKLMNIRDKIDFVTSLFAFGHWHSSDIINIAVSSSFWQTRNIIQVPTILTQFTSYAHGGFSTS